MGIVVHLGRGPTTSFAQSEVLAGVSIATASSVPAPGGSPAQHRPG